MNSRDPASPSPARRWRIVSLILLVAVIALGIALTLKFGGRITPLLDTL